MNYQIYYDMKNKKFEKKYFEKIIKTLSLQKNYEFIIDGQVISITKKMIGNLIWLYKILMNMIALFYELI
jgi:hypothetical protein